jgi:hypothetical protein
MDDRGLKADKRRPDHDGVVLREHFLERVERPVDVAQRDRHMIRLAAVGDKLAAVGENDFATLRRCLRSAAIPAGLR